jgi:PAS domain S-box-containing protein
VESSDDAIIGKTLDGIITDWNQGAERLYGYTAAEMVGQSIARLIPPDLQDDLPAILARLRRGERIDHYETQRVARDGTRRDVALTISPIRDAAGQLVGASKIARDITARKQAEAALTRAAAELEQRVQERTAALHREMTERQRLAQEAQRAQHFALLGRLAAGLAHELRNPLGALFLHVDIVREEIQHPSPDSVVAIDDALSELTRHLARVTDLVENYVVLMPVAPVERTPQDLGTLLRAWTTAWMPLATASGVTLRSEGLETVGVVVVHASTLHRALLNLVQNALEAMPQGGTLTLRGRRQGTTVRLDIEDTGSGIAPEQQVRIFEPLHTTKPGGTGLGLYLVQEVVAVHGGQVTVQSAVGHGSTFTVTLPADGR